MQFKTELHCHTSPVSRCAHSDAAKLLSEYKAAGYTTVVLTNHMSMATFENISGSWKDKVRYYVNGYKQLKQLAGTEMNILLGTEINLEGSTNDYLVYGVDEKFFLDNPQLIQMNLHSLSELCRSKGLPLYQAHPFRKFMAIVRPEYLDGIEVNNGNIRHDSSNPIAELWSDRYNLKKISGSDYHDPADLTVNGLVTDIPIKTNDELISVLKKDNYKLLRSDLK
ncbi:MAG: hypothetical protein A2Y17_08575 [Clostridiales bacterium GWF2_38_85]|nr:MAG: hypothetical protein A2Y17_08575 [Clostridiales bacterium GWF2_38_85]HBL83751.1 transposase [Clostridiales bacterium]